MRILLYPKVQSTLIGGEHYIDCVGTVQVLRLTGLPLAEIKHYVELYESRDQTLHLRKAMLSSQKSKVEKQIARLMKTLEKRNYKLTLIDVQENKFDRLP
jgi:DNA-binding transcriptional MerR regulator